MLFTAAHELTHFIKENSPEHFEALEKIVTESFTKNGISIDALIDKQIEKAKNDGREISREDAREEMIADACETMLADGSLVKKLSALKTENRGLWNAIKQFFENLFGKIDKLYRSLKPDSTEGKYIADMRKTAKKLKAAFAEGLTAVSEKKTVSPQKRGKIMFDARESLQNAAKSLETISDEAYLEAKRNTPFVLVMEQTPRIIFDSLNNGKNRKVLIRRDALYLAIRESGVQDGHYHGLGADVLSDLPKYLEDPDVILSTKTENGEENQSRRLLLTHIPVKNGQAIISVEFETMKDFEGKYDYFNLVITVFDLHENYLKRLFKKNSAVIKYEKKDLSQVNPQLYEWLRIINEKPSTNSISHPGQNVNSKKTENIKPSARSNMSTGQINKLKANYTHEKVYSKKLAFDIISRFSSAGDFKAKTREAIAESLWEGLNSCTSIEQRRTFAHDTAVFVVGKMLSESRANNPEAEAAREKLAYLRSGIQRITFSESDIEEIKHLRDVAGHRSIQSRWGYKKNSSGRFVF